jgi:hypothetical protein
MSVESGVGVACGCLPGCKPLMNKLFPQYFGSTNGSSNQYPRRWQQNHYKQADDKKSTQQSDLTKQESIHPTYPSPAHASTSAQPAVLQRTISKQTKSSVVSSLSPQSSIMSRSNSRGTQRTVDANSLQSLRHHQSPSYMNQSSFKTTITAESPLSRSASRKTSRWMSADVNKPLPMRPPPSAIALRRPSASGFRRSRRASRDLDEISNESTEMFILQGRDSIANERLPERRNGV